MLYISLEKVAQFNNPDTSDRFYKLFFKSVVTKQSGRRTSPWTRTSVLMFKTQVHGNQKVEKDNKKKKNSGSSNI